MQMSHSHRHTLTFLNHENNPTTDSSAKDTIYTLRAPLVNTNQAQQYISIEI